MHNETKKLYFIICHVAYVVHVPDNFEVYKFPIFGDILKIYRRDTDFSVKIR